MALKAQLKRDFLGLVDIFVSSDIGSIAAGDEWLTSVNDALQQSALLIVFCSPISIRRPWINFEAGAAWALRIPIIPVCHAGMTPRDLPIPLSLRQGISIDDPDGLRRLYARVAKVISSDVPEKDFDALAQELSEIATETEANSPDMTKLQDDRGIWKRLEQSLNHPAHTWRSLERLAFEAGVSEEVAADLLRGKSEIRFSKGRTGQIIAALTARVGDK